MFGFTVNPPVAALSAVSVTPSSITSGQAGTGTVTLTSAAGSGGVAVSLSSSNSTAAGVPASVTIPQGSTSATFSVNAGNVSGSTPVTLTASYSGVNKTFGLTINPPVAALSSISVSPNVIIGGQSGTGTVTLTAAAGSGGVNVSLSSSNTMAAGVPVTVTVPQGSTSATFTVNTATVSAATPVTLTASYSGVNATFGFTVNPLAAALSAVSVSPSAITSGQTGTGTVTLSATAGSGGVAVSLSSSNSTAAGVPSSVTIPQGSISATFSVNAGNVSSSTPVTLTASYSGVNKTFTVTINPPAAALSSVTVSPSILIGGQSATGTVSLMAAAGAGGVVVALSSSNTNAASVPASVMVPQGSASATFPVTTGTMRVPTPAMVTATYSGINKTFGLTVDPLAPALSSISISPGSITSGQSGTGTVSLTSPAGSGGVMVSLFSANAAVAGVPSSVTILQGATSATFTVNAGSVIVSTSAMVSAYYSGVNASFTVTVTPAAVAGATASFVALDSTTQGNWRNKYNFANVTIIGDGAVNTTVTPVPSGENAVTWNPQATTARALENLESTGRIAARWAAAANFFVDINYTDQAVHQIAIYCLDWNEMSRAETISVLDATTNKVLDSRSVSNFTKGVYAVWNVTGHVKLQITKTAGNNAVISGLFLN
ncbi:MAG TPA: hypothetical protein VK708_06685 [Bryobacteraceae bacterium]|nr:hypothetical protein [Bryobacteraceae bacterium]